MATVMTITKKVVELTEEEFELYQEVLQEYHLIAEGMLDDENLTVKQHVYLFEIKEILEILYTNIFKK